MQAASDLGQWYAMWHIGALLVETELGVALTCWTRGVEGRCWRWLPTVHGVRPVVCPEVAYHKSSVQWEVMYGTI